MPLKHLRPGMRCIKTAIAVFVCILFYELMHVLSLSIADIQNDYFELLGFFLKRMNPAFACVAAIVAMQSTIEDSWENGKRRIIGALLGGLIGLGALYADIAVYNRGFTIVILPLSVLFVIWFCNIIGQPNSTAFAAITLTIIMLSVDKYNMPAYLYALNRTIDTAIGVFVSMLVNLSLKKPRWEEPMEQS